MSSSSSSSASVTSGSGVRLGDIVSEFWKNYSHDSSPRMRVIDAFLAFLLATAAIQFVYMVMVGSFPFNSFLAGIFVCIGTFVLTVGLRMQIKKENNVNISPERAYADYALACVVLFLVVLVYMG